MSKSPHHLIMRDRRTGRPIFIPVEQIPKELWPDTWYDQVYWRYSKAVTSAEVGEFYKVPRGEISEALAQKLARYIYDYAANVAVGVWLLNPNRKKYLEYMRPCLQQLKALQNKARTRVQIMDMIDVALDYAVDPF